MFASALDGSSSRAMREAGAAGSQGELRADVAGGGRAREVEALCQRIAELGETLRLIGGFDAFGDRLQM